ncbi:AMP deaminase [Cladophialophora carrionii CBS 160.54]|uniref:AMP deaminase n=1 Tax=Cladophialophora carrionii CBS 160.54 TaxID=1279043 RepID=V9DH74_9EURO|nr:AMP deaminase [Cladophialophora carrionii CBS 160.54]ETI26244.1 AMP deaminase [Cladophialophora carrionii CBS 160.54]
MDSRSTARPNPEHSTTVDSDDEADVYDWKASRVPDSQDDARPRKDSTRKGAKQAQNGNEGEDEGHYEPVGPGEADSSDELPEDGHMPHPFYHYAAEKRDTFADSKLIYQRHRMDTKSEKELGSPLLLGKSYTLPAGAMDGEAAALHRTPSTTSRQSRLSQRGNAPSGIQLTRAKDSVPSLQTQVGNLQDIRPDPTLVADAAARDHKRHPGLPHEFKDPLLAHEGMHGAGAGMGLGSGPGGLAPSEESVISEVRAICEKIKTVLDLRQKYMKISLQCPGDNPKDDENWEIYPPPPNPVWNEHKAREQPPDYIAPNSTSSSLYMADLKARNTSGGDINTWASNVSQADSERGAPPSPTSVKKARKQGHDVGEDFDLNECIIPGRQEKSLHYEMDAGSVFQVYGPDGKPLVEVPTLRDYFVALDTILDIASDGPAKSFAYRRLQYLEGRYSLYTLLNEYEEVADTKKVPHRDFYNVRKVDTHVHHSACMNQKHLLRFIKSKMKKCPNEVVIERDGKQLTLKEVFDSINLTAYDLSIDTLDMHAHTDSFHRFDKFNLKYNPIGQSRLRDIFLKTDNFIKGRYLAEITKEVITDLESSKYQMVEWRISIYGRSIKEWDTLASWVVDNKLFSHNVRWLIQIPRLFALYKSLKTVDNFEQLLRNIFAPLFEVTQDPSTHPKLHIFLQRVIGFDSVDDESKVERRLYRKFPTAREWDTKQNPPYGYWIYYLFANMTSLNAWRKRRGFNTFLLRPHCGEAGDTDHLAAALLCSHSISHGITLRKVPLLQYIFYLEQIGVAMSPLSNNALFLTYDRNPFISYFKKGLNVSLSTDDPLQFAFTKEPLIEEYSVAAQIYKLSAVDMCELAKHSVDQCGFELSLKQRWLGKYCYLPGVLGNDVAKCNVPDVREAFRHETLKAEHAFIAKYTNDYCHYRRCTPDLPPNLMADPATTSPVVDEAYNAYYAYRGLESPRQYYATMAVADSIAPAQQAREREREAALLSKSVSNSNFDNHSNAAATAQGQGSQGTTGGGGGGNVSPTRPRRTSSIHALYHAAASTSADAHISGQEPRAFPGLVHQRERRRSLRVGSGNSDGTQHSSDMTSSLHLEPGLAKITLKEDKEMNEIEDDAD